MKKSARNTLIVGIILVILVVVIYLASTKSGGGNTPKTSPWDAIKKAWPSAGGTVLNTVVGASAGSASTSWVADNAPDIGRPMQQADANVVCTKACDGWGKTAAEQVDKYCDCTNDTAVNF